MNTCPRQLQAGPSAPAGIAAVVTTLAFAFPVLAQVSYTSQTGGAYDQNFDSLQRTGSRTFLQDTPGLTSDTVGIDGWYAYRSGTTDDPRITAGDGWSNTAILYSYGTVGAEDRALGSLGTPSVGDFVWAVRIRNDTGLAITGFTVRYTGEQWRYNSNGEQSIKFGYGIFAPENAQSRLALLAAGTSGFNDVGSMEFFSPVTNAGPIAPTLGGLNGNDAANRATHTATIAATIPVGHDIWFRWNDINHIGSDHGLATDDFRFAATQYQPVPAPPAAVSLAIGGFIGLIATGLQRRRNNNRKGDLRTTSTPASARADDRPVLSVAIR